jgi:hypothetical protein
MHMNILYPSIKVLVKRTFFVACVKMTKNSYVNSNFVA